MVNKHLVQVRNVHRVIGARGTGVQNLYAPQKAGGVAGTHQRPRNPELPTQKSAQTRNFSLFLDLVGDRELGHAQQTPDRSKLAQSFGVATQARVP